MSLWAPGRQQCRRWGSEHRGFFPPFLDSYSLSVLQHGLPMSCSPPGVFLILRGSPTGPSPSDVSLLLCGSPHWSQSLRSVPALAQVTHRPQSLRVSLTCAAVPSETRLIQHKNSASPAYPGNVPFHALLPEPSSMSLPVPPLVAPHVPSPFMHAPMSPPIPPPVPPAPSSYCPFLHVSEQQQHALLWQVEVLARGGLFSPMPELSVTSQTASSRPPPTPGALQPPPLVTQYKYRYPDCGGNSPKKHEVCKSNDNDFQPKIARKTRHMPFPQLLCLYSPVSNSYSIDIVLLLNIF